VSVGDIGAASKLCSPARARPLPRPGSEHSTSSPLDGLSTTNLDSRVSNALESLAGALDVLCEADAHELSVETLYAVVREAETASRRLAGMSASVLTAIEADGRWATDGSRSLAAWVRRATDASPGRAHRQTRTARALRDHLPLTAAALSAGAIGTEHVELLAKHTTSSAARLAGLGHEQVGEAFLVQQAAELDAGDFARLVKRWAFAADPEASDRDWKDDLDKENVVLAKSLHGYHLQGWLSDAGGAALDTALRARAGVPSADDTRTTAQRRAAALVSLARLALDSGAVAPGAGVRPHLTVHVPYETLERLAEAQAPQGSDSASGQHEDGQRAAPRPGGSMRWRGNTVDGCTPVTRTSTETRRSTETRPSTEARPSGLSGPSTGTRPSTMKPTAAVADASVVPGDASVIPGGLHHEALIGVAPAELDDGTPLPPALLARLACDSELARVVFGPNSEILDSGRTKRLFTPGQRRAIVARDRTCRYPGCDAPPHEGEIHHSIWWYAQYGQTRARDGVLLCWFHHDHVHANAISIERRTSGDTGEAAGEQRWEFRDRNGRVIRATPARADCSPAA
jgi:hypothetical protein